MGNLRTIFINILSSISLRSSAANFENILTSLLFALSRFCISKADNSSEVVRYSESNPWGVSLFIMKSDLISSKIVLSTLLLSVSKSFFRYDQILISHQAFFLLPCGIWFKVNLFSIWFNSLSSASQWQQHRRL